jgi:hypothetical protein
MEMEYFVKPDAEHLKLVDEWVEQYLEWFKGLGIKRDNLKLHEVPGKSLAHYSKRTVDIMYRYFPERRRRATVGRVDGNCLPHRLRFAIALEQAGLTRRQSRQP